MSELGKMVYFWAQDQHFLNFLLIFPSTLSEIVTDDWQSQVV